MGLVERLNELGSMRQNGQISDSEYALLVESATKNFGKENEVANQVASESVSETSKLSSQSKNLAKESKLVVVGVIVVLIIAFLALSRGGAGDSPGVSEPQISEATNTEPVSDNDKFRKARIEIHLKRSKSSMENLKENRDKYKAESSTSAFKFRKASFVSISAKMLVDDIAAAFEEFPELASASTAITSVLRRYENLFGENESSILSQADEIWPIVIEENFKWEKALQKLIDESP